MKEKELIISYKEEEKMKFYRCSRDGYYNLDSLCSFGFVDGSVRGEYAGIVDVICEIEDFESEIKAKEFLDKLMWAYLFTDKVLITYEFVMGLPANVMDKEDLID